MIIYQIRLPKKQNAEVFVTFMQEEYFPAVRKGPTRVGKVTDLVLLRSVLRGGPIGREFFLHVGWSGLEFSVFDPSSGVGVLESFLDDETVAGKLESFKARIKQLGFYSEIAAWHEGEVA